MGYFTFPVQGVKFRIRNVDYRECLEQRPDDDDVVLRSEHDDPLQYWTFSWVDSRNHTCKIYDADGDSTLYVQTVQSTSNTTPNIKYGTPTANDEDIWKLITDPLKDGRTYIVSKLSLLYMKDRDTMSLMRESSENRIKSHIRKPSHQWEIVEVSPTQLPLGQNQRFRIRTLNGQALQVDPSAKLMLEKEDKRGNHRAWLIKDLRNGSCTIFNEGLKKYLTTRDKGSYEWEPIVMAEADFQAEDDKKWTVQPTSDFTYSIYTQRDVIYQSEVRQQSLSLALDNGNAILKAKKAAHNQIWLIEPEDAPISQPEDGTDPTTSEEVAPDLTPGEYKIKNMNSNEYYIKVVNRSGSYTFVSSASTGANKFKVELKTGGVVFYARLSAKDIYLAANSTGDSVVGQENQAYIWTVTKGDRSDQYFITNGVGKALSSPSDRGTALTLGLKTQGANQQWKFI